MGSRDAGPDTIAADVTERLANAPPAVVAAYLYGSTARGTHGASSDVDVALLLGARPAPTVEGRMLEYEAELERALGRRVQVVVLNDAPVDLVHRVLRDGRILIERDRAARIRFEVRARNEYFDLLPVLRRYRAAAIAKAAVAR